MIGQKMKQVMCTLGMVLVTVGAVAHAAAPIVADSRIRTYIYNPNEVFKVATEFGYQSNIEFAKDERVEMISLGDVSGFRITPEDNRIFLRALKPDFHTNMTVLTNERTYYFDLTSFVERNEDIMYVLRFYYPENDLDEGGVPLDMHAYLKPAPREKGTIPPPPPGFSPPPMGQMPPPMVSVPPAPMPPMQSYAPPPPMQSMDRFAPPSRNIGRNLSYSLQGPDQYAPWQVFDEEGQTYVQFPHDLQMVPPMYVMNPQGQPVPLMARPKGNYLVIDGVFERFFIGDGPDQVVVFNDEMLQAQAQYGGGAS